MLLFWGSAAVLAWTYVGYALALARTVRRQSLPEPAATPSGASTSTVSVVIAAKNESARIAGKLEQLLDQNCDLIREIIVVCDHCTDDTAEIVGRFAAQGVRAVLLPEGHAGKGAAVNAGVAQASGELILFNDVRQSLSPDAVRRLAAWFDDPANGAVSGSLEIQSSAQGSGKGLDAYWSIEKRIRHHESQLDSSIGCTGAIYMVRRSLYRPIPHDTILDDVVIPMLIAEQGFRVRFDPEARAFDPQPLTGAQEARRKKRTLAGNFQMLFRHPRWLLPWRHRLWFKLISHKYLRVLSPFFLAVCVVASFGLLHRPFFQLALAGQLALGVLAVVGLAIPGLRARIFTLPAAFLLLQWSVVRGFAFWLSMGMRGQQGWK